MMSLDCKNNFTVYTGGKNRYRSSKTEMEHTKLKKMIMPKASEFHDDDMHLIINVMRSNDINQRFKYLGIME